MVDQDQIDRRVISWIHHQAASNEGDASDFYERWEQFVASHNAETAQAFHRSPYFEVFRLLDALVEGLQKDHQTGIPMDESVMENIRQAGSPGFMGNRDEVRRRLDALIENKDKLLEYFRIV
jgi:hypothetical protein